MLSHAIPVIAIQGNIVKIDGVRALQFIKVLDTYEEVDDGTSEVPGVYDEQYWQEWAPWTLDFARLLQTPISPTLPEASLRLQKRHIGVAVHNRNYFYLNRRVAPKTLLTFRIVAPLLEEATRLLDEAGIPFVHRSKQIRMTIGCESIETHREMFGQLTESVRKTLQELR